MKKRQRSRPPILIHGSTGKGLAGLLAEVFSDLQVKVLGVEGHYLTYQQYKEVEEALQSSRPGSRIVFPDGLVESLRIIKEPSEIDLIRASLDVTEKVLNEIWHRLQPGMTETDLAWEIESSIRTREPRPCPSLPLWPEGRTPPSRTRFPPGGPSPRGRPWFWTLVPSWTTTART